MQLGSFNSVHTYRVNFSPTDRDGILIFACPREHTEREEAEKRDRPEEDRKKAEAAHRQKQADEKQQQKVTSQGCAVRVFQFHAYILRLFLSDRLRWGFDFCMSPGAHRTRGSGEATQSRRGQKKSVGGKVSKASG